jgi:hypothetical protein
VPFFDATETFGTEHAFQGEGLGSGAQWFSGWRLLNPLYTGSDGYIYQRNAPGQQLGLPGRQADVGNDGLPWTPVPGRFKGGVLPDPTRVFGGGIDLPGAFSTDFAKITPFVDYPNDRDQLYTTSDVTPIIANMLIASGTYSDDSIRTHKWMATAGFEFVNDPIGIDSIVYGGLKK